MESFYFIVQVLKEHIKIRRNKQPKTKKEGKATKPKKINHFHQISQPRLPDPDLTTQSVQFKAKYFIHHYSSTHFTTFTQNKLVKRLSNSHLPFICTYSSIPHNIHIIAPTPRLVTSPLRRNVAPRIPWMSVHLGRHHHQPVSSPISHLCCHG